MTLTQRLIAAALVLTLIAVALSVLVGGMPWTRALLVALVMMLLVLLLVPVGARRLVAPLVALRDHTRAIAAGDLSRRPPLAAPGEIGDLASAVHRMREQLSIRLTALESDEALFEAVSNSLNEGLIAVDERGSVTRINSRARALIGAPDTVPFSADHLPRDRVFREALAAVRAGEAVDGLEVDIGPSTVEVSGRPLRDGGAVFALFDVTRLRHLERVRRDFVANVSHELKTPLTALGGFAETLTDESLSAQERRQFAAVIVKNAQRMQRLVDDLLDLSRIESGGWRPAPALTDLRAVVADAIAGARTRLGEAPVTLEADIAPDSSDVFADPTALSQIIGNLLDNAIRHTSSGSVTLSVRRERDGGGVLLQVRDTGEGIAAEHLPRIFERFYRADAARARSAGGTGLGLAIVRHLVEAHGGTVTAQSTLGSGTTITVHLPDRRG